MARELRTLTCACRYTGLHWLPSLFGLTVAAGNCCSYYLLNTAWPTRGADFFYKDSGQRRTRSTRDELRAEHRYEADTMSTRAKNVLRKSFTSFSTLFDCIRWFRVGVRGGGVCQADVYQWNISSHLPGLASLRWCCLMKNGRQIGQSPARPLQGPPSTHPDSVGIIKSGGNYLRRKRYALLSRQQVMVRRSLPRPIDCLTSQWVGGISSGTGEGYFP